MFAQYRFAMRWAVPAGAVIGAAIGGVITLAGIAANGSVVSLGGLAFGLALWAAGGALFGLAGLLGGMLTVWLADRHSAAAPRVWILGGSLGATAGVIVMWLIVAIVLSFSAMNVPNAFAYVLLPGFISAMVACVSATVVLDKCSARFEDVSPDAAPEPAR